MIDPVCNKPIAFPALLEYWFGELASGNEEALEEHLLGCGHCAGRLREIVELGSEIRSSFGRGEFHAVVSQPFLDKMKQNGLRFREYRVSPGGSVACTIAAAEDAVVGRLQAPLEGVKRLDLVRVGEPGEFPFTLLDIPFDAAAGEVVFCPSMAALKQMPAHNARVRLVATDEAGARTIGDYTFIHTP